MIPKPIRDYLKLRPGDKLDFIVQPDGGVLIRPAVEDVRKLKGILHRPGRRAVTIGEMNRVIQQRGGRR